MVGLDKDPSMLAFTRQHLPVKAKAIQLIQGDLTAFHFGQSFPLILLPCNTYSTLTAAERRSTLERVSEHLPCGGIFAASLTNPVLLRRLPRSSDPEFEESFFHPVDGEPVQVSSGWKRTKEQFILTWHYDHLLPDGRVERISASVRHYLEKLNTYLDEFRWAKLDIFRLLGDFDRSPYQAAAPNLIFLVKKPTGGNNFRRFA